MNRLINLTGLLLVLALGLAACGAAQGSATPIPEAGSGAASQTSPGVDFEIATDTPGAIDNTSTPGPAQITETPPASAKSSAAAAAGNPYFLSAVMGYSVVDLSQNPIGSISGFAVEPTSGKILYAAIAPTAGLALAPDNEDSTDEPDENAEGDETQSDPPLSPALVPWEALEISAPGSAEAPVVILSINPSVLASVPAFDANRMSEAGWDAEIVSYWSRAGVPVTGSETGQTAAQAGGAIFLQSVNDIQVINANDSQPLGEVAELVIDPAAGAAEYVLVTANEAAGVENGCLLPVPFWVLASDEMMAGDASPTDANDNANQNDSGSEKKTVELMTTGSPYVYFLKVGSAHLADAPCLSELADFPDASASDWDQDLSEFWDRAGNSTDAGDAQPTDVVQPTDTP